MTSERLRHTVFLLAAACVTGQGAVVVSAPIKLAAATFNSTHPPELWGSLQPGAYGVGFKRHVVSRAGAAVYVDVWYPAEDSPPKLRFEDYLRLSTDLRGAVGGMDTAESLASSLSAAISGEADAVPRHLVERILNSRMAAVRDAAPLPPRFPVALWTPRYATTVAQSVLSEYLASHGFIVAFARPELGGRLPFELSTSEAKARELEERVADMKAALDQLERVPNVDPSRVAILAWSYTGEMATRLQMDEPRVKLVVGLSTNVLADWVFQPERLAAIDASRLTAAYAVLTQRGDTLNPIPAALGGAGAGYFIEFPGVAHGSFNALEGYIPSLLGIGKVQRWSQSSAGGARAYEAAAAITLRLLRHHVERSMSNAMAAGPLTAGIPDGVVHIRETR